MVDNFFFIPFLDEFFNHFFSSLSFFQFLSLFSAFWKKSKSLQHSLVTEIREIVYPEDRLRFDELMFRHGVTVNVLSNNVATLYGRSGVRLLTFLTHLCFI